MIFRKVMKNNLCFTKKIKQAYVALVFQNTLTSLSYPECVANLLVIDLIYAI